MQRASTAKSDSFASTTDEPSKKRQRLPADQKSSPASDHSSTIPEISQAISPDADAATAFAGSTDETKWAFSFQMQRPKNSDISTDGAASTLQIVTAGYAGIDGDPNSNRRGQVSASSDFTSGRKTFGRPVWMAEVSVIDWHAPIVCGCDC